MDTKRTHPHLGQVVNSSCGCFCASHGFSFLEYQHSHFLLSSLWAAILAYLSFPPIPNRRTLPAALISPSSLMCTHTHGTHTHTPMNPCALRDLFCFSPSSSLNLVLFFTLLICSLTCSLKKTSRPARSFLVQCALPSMTSSAVVLCHSAWGLSLKPKAALEEASDGFCPLFHSLAFIPLCSQQISRQIPNKHVI